MNVYKYFARMVLLCGISTITSCTLTPKESHDVRFTCASSEAKELKPPDGTYKVAVELAENECKSGAVQLLMDGEPLKDKVFDLSKTKRGRLFTGDWYGNSLGLGFIPDDSGSGTVSVDVTFSYNR